MATDCSSFKRSFDTSLYVGWLMHVCANVRDLPAKPLCSTKDQHGTAAKYGQQHVPGVDFAYLSGGSFASKSLPSYLPSLL